MLRVKELMNNMIVDLINRAETHDLTKLESPEKEIFDREGDSLKTLVYNSDEYKASLERLGIALEHHYNFNSHHPQHYKNGVDGMDLLDLVEMICDWKASSERNVGNTLDLDKNFERFGFSEQLASIFRNTKERYF